MCSGEQPAYVARRFAIVDATPVNEMIAVQCSLVTKR